MNTAAAAPPFDWTLMRSFLAVVERGSLLAAARALGSSQPTVGRHVAALEVQLGAALFERTGRGLVPTRLARDVADHARAMGEHADAIRRAVADRRQRPTGSVRITASQTVACALLPPLLARLRENEPGIEIELVASNALANLLRREADIAVRMVRPEQASVVARRIAQVSLGTWVARDFAARHGVPRTLQALADFPLVGFDSDRSIERGFAARGLVVPRSRFVLRTDDHVASWAAVVAGIGVGFGADWLGRREPRVMRVLPELVLPPLPMWLAVHREVRNSGPIRAVYDFLAAALPAALASTG